MLDQKIETFLSVVKYGSYTAAAKALHMTQPAVTQHIHKLEEFYGCQLIDSKRRAIRLTEEGKLLYQYLSLQQANSQEFSLLLRNTIKPLCVGATLSIADYYLPQLLVKEVLNKEERLRVLVSNTSELIKKLHNDEIDCAFVEGLFDTSFVETKTFLDAQFIPVVAKNHPLANKKITLKEIHEYPLILREPYSGTRQILEGWLKERNDSILSFSQTIELGSFILIKECIAQSQAITFVYKGVVEKELERGELATFSLEHLDIIHSLLFIYRKGDPRCKQFESFFYSLIE